MSLLEDKKYLENIASQFSCFPFFEVQESKHVKILLPKKEDEIYIYSGTFDPFHQGHQYICQYFKNKNIVVVPDVNPFKLKSINSNIIGYYENIVSLAKVPVYPGFIGQEKGNPTSSWFPKLKYKKKHFIMGDDSLNSFDKWINVEVLVSSIDCLHVFIREMEVETLKLKIEEVKNQFKIKIKGYFENPYKEVSSTKINSLR